MHDLVHLLGILGLSRHSTHSSLRIHLAGAAHFKCFWGRESWRADQLNLAMAPPCLLSKANPKLSLFNPLAHNTEEANPRNRLFLTDTAGHRRQTQSNADRIPSSDEIQVRRCAGVQVSESE